ncbi:MAG: hypothetical protein QG567_2326 [Campylobacterota bacterium]|nr:hypothetical protein [Campylobacterota bacterium]
MKKEQITALNVAKFLQVKYPKVIYRFDLVADMPLSIFQANRNKALHGRFSKGYPDLFIAVCRGGYGGLYLELKADDSTPFKKDGTLKKNEHLEMQNNRHEQLREAGYYVAFAVGFKQSVEIIEKYMEFKIKNTV